MQLKTVLMWSYLPFFALKLTVRNMFNCCALVDFPILHSGCTAAFHPLCSSLGKQEVSRWPQKGLSLKPLLQFISPISPPTCPVCLYTIIIQIPVVESRAEH